MNIITACTHTGFLYSGNKESVEIPSVTFVIIGVRYQTLWQTSCKTHISHNLADVVVSAIEQSGSS